MRLDQAVAARYEGISRRKARELIAAKRVFVNDRPVGVASREVNEGDRITIAEELPEIEVIRETADWIAVNKPSGMPTQPSRDRKQRSLEELLRIRCRTIHLVHRIDTQTSGVVVFAKHRVAAAELSKLFAARAIRKTYVAIVEGVLDGGERVIDQPIEGRSAVTKVRPVAVLADGNTHIEADILTGRTHQIRIHMQAIGHPVMGDRRYGATQAAPRLMLHAMTLDHPYFGGELIAPAPSELTIAGS